MKSCKDCQRTTCNATCLSKKMKQDKKKDKKKDPDKRKGETASDERCRWKGYWCDKYKGRNGD